MDVRVVAVALAVCLVVGSVPFAVGVSPDAGGGAVDFEDTVAVGVSEGVVREAQRTSLVLPRAQVFYSRYRYPVGYNGISSLVADLQSETDRGLGRPLRVYVTDFAGEPLRVAGDGTLRLSEVRVTGWVRAEDAFFVVGSRARVPTRGAAVVPFSDRADAEAFAGEYGGEVVDGEAVRSRPADPPGHTAAEWDHILDRRGESADSTVAARRRLLDRPVSVVVGRDAPTLAAAVRRAPPNTTVRLPPGTYEVPNLSVAKPVSVVGAGPNATRVRGDGNGSVVRVRSPRTAIARLSITGVGPRRSGANVSPEAVGANRSEWNYHMRKVHGYGDAAVVFDAAPSSLVADVRIDTTSNGVVARDSADLAVTNLTLYGTKRWEDGFLGVAAIGSRVVVQDSAFYGGKVGVFALDVEGVVVRDSRMEGMMLGVFNLYGRNLTIRDNRIEDTLYGVYVEMRSTETAVVGNAVRLSKNGVIVSGTANYVAENVIARNEWGLVVEGHYSLYRRNVVAYNRVGTRSLTLLPTNEVTDNDVVENRVPAETASYDVVHVWRGNYWSDAPGLLRGGDGALRRSYRPTGPVDGAVGRVPRAETVARSPTTALLRHLAAVVPGLRAGGVLDPAPRATPVRERVVERLNDAYDDAGRGEDDDDWDASG